MLRWRYRSAPPSEVIVELVGCAIIVGRLDDPFAAARGMSSPKRWVEADDKGEGLAEATRVKSSRAALRRFALRCARWSSSSRSSPAWETG